MIERAYTVAEIDTMRLTITHYGWPGGGSYYPAQRAAEIEDRLRTYMIAGVEPEDLNTELVAAYHAAIRRWDENNQFLTGRRLRR